MNHFFTQLPVIITQFSLALIKALTDQLKWLGSIYYHIETALLGTVADISLAILSLRYVFLLLLIGGALGYFGLWWFLAGYVLVILIGVVRLFQSASLPPDPDVEKAHQELRDKSVKFLRIPLRALAMLVSLYFSWQFIDWKAITPSSFETLASNSGGSSTTIEGVTSKVTSTIDGHKKDVTLVTGQEKSTEPNISVTPVVKQQGGTLETASEKDFGDISYCTKNPIKVSFTPSGEIFTNKPLLTTVNSGEYLITITGTRQQKFTSNEGSVYFREMDANGVMSDTHQIWTTEEFKNDSDSAPFPTQAYGGVVLHLNESKKFIGNRHWFTVKQKTELHLDVNVFQHKGNFESKGTLQVTLMECSP